MLSLLYIRLLAAEGRHGNGAFRWQPGAVASSAVCSLAYRSARLVALLATVPFLWGVMTSLETARQISGTPLALVPDPLVFENYGRAMAAG